MDKSSRQGNGVNITSRKDADQEGQPGQQEFRVVDNKISQQEDEEETSTKVADRSSQQGNGVQITSRKEDDNTYTKVDMDWVEISSRRESSKPVQSARGNRRERCQRAGEVQPPGEQVSE